MQIRSPQALWLCMGFLALSLQAAAAETDIAQNYIAMYTKRAPPQPTVYGIEAKSDSYAAENSKCKPFDIPSRKFMTHIDFLYWKADEDGLEYATKMVSSPLIGAAAKTHMKLHDLHFEWNPGFCLGIGYTFNHVDNWQINLDWTRIRNHAHGHASAKGIESTGNTNTLVSPWVNLLFKLGEGASKASAHWHLEYDTLDLDFGRNVRLSKRLNLDPFFGFRAAWLDQDYHAEYKSVFVLAEGAPAFTRNVKFKADNDFHAFGLRGGAELTWHLSRHWQLFSKLSANVLYGSFKVHMKNLHDQGLGEGATPPMPLDLFAKEHFNRVRLNFEEAIGLGWEAFFKCQRYHLQARADYELSQWLNQNELFYTFYFQGQDTVSNVPIRSQGDLSFHGIRISLQFEF